MPEAAVQTPSTPAPAQAQPQRRFELPPDAAKDPAPAPATPAATPPAETPVPKADGQNTGEEAPPAAPEGEKPATEKDDPEKRGSRRFERRLDRAYRRAAEEKARADLLAKQISELQAKQTPATPADPGEPKIEDFDDIQKFADAKAKYAADKAVKEHEAKQREAAQREVQERTLSEWEKKYAKGEDVHDDFEEKVGKLDPRIPMNAAIMQAENGEEIAYYLGSNLKEAERIIRLDPLSQIREIGKLEAKLLSTPEKPKAPSRAPAPITPLTGATPATSDLPSESDDMKEWIRKRERQVRGKR